MNDNTPPQMCSAEINQAVEDARMHAPLLVLLFEAARDGVISLAIVMPGVTAPLDALDRNGLPAVVLLIDNRGSDSDPGPTGWNGLDRLAGWAAHVFVNAVGELVGNYYPAISYALEHKRIVLIETAPSRFLAWHIAMSGSSGSVFILGTCDDPAVFSARRGITH